MRHQILRGVGDVDRSVIGLNATLVRFAISKGHFLEHDIPAFRCFGEGVGIVHQNVRTPLIGRPVMHAVNRVPWRAFQAVIDGVPAWDQVGIDRLNAFAGNHAQRRIARCGDKIKAAFVHQRDHFIGCVGGFDIHRASGFLFKGGYPVKIGIRFAALDIARPGNDIHGTFRCAKFGHHVSGSRLTGGKGKHDHHGRA